MKYLYKILQVLALLLPTKNIILFESMEDFDGSSLSVYRYLIEHGYHKKYRLVWAVRDINKVPDDGIAEVIELNKHSFKNLVTEAQAKYVFYEHTYPVFRLRKKKSTCVYLTHGFPILKNVKGRLTIGHLCDYCICTSEFMRNMQEEQYGVPQNKMYISGLPRDDIFVEEHHEFEKISSGSFDKIIMWMPTFRKEKHSSRSDSTASYYLGLPVVSNKDEMAKLNEKLKEKNVCLVIKLHPNALIESDEMIDLSNIIIVTKAIQKQVGFETYKFLTQTDALISDYSSVAYEYMLMDKPLAYVISDMKEYKIGFAFDNITDFMPGHLIENFDDLLSFVDDISLGKDIHRERRNEVSKLGNDYPAGGNTERIVKHFIE